MQKQKTTHHNNCPLYRWLTLIGILALFSFRFLPGTHFGAYALPEKDYHQRDGIHTPCTFFDTVNITDDMNFPNGSYLHDGVMIPRHLVGTYDYVYISLVERVEVMPHMRGCICKLKPCINFCCPWGTIYDGANSTCRNSSDIMWPEPNINVTFADNSLKSSNIFQQFVVQNFRPCLEMFSLQPELNSYDAWTLFENGTLFRQEDSTYILKNEYCMVPTTVNDTDTMFIINPANCDTNMEFGTVKIINAFTMLFSIPFIVLTIVVYLLIPELRNLHGKSLVCYLLNICIGYSTLGCVSLLHDLHPDGVPCKILGYTAYYGFLSAFFWLNVISFDLWHNFRGTRGVNRFQEKKRFLLYSLYSWGSALVFLLFTMYAQERLDWSDYWKPGIGGGTYCWLDMKTWAAMIYFFAPILLIILANTVMFIMTALKIHTVQREMARIVAREDSTKSLRSEKDNFGLFLRLFLIMGVTWTSEIFSYFVGQDSKWSKFFYITDLCNAMQGFLIFMLFVLKKKVKHLITKRLSKHDAPGSSQTNSTNSTNSEINTNPGKLNMNDAHNGLRPKVAH